MGAIAAAAVGAGGLDAGQSALITACASAVRGYPGLLRESLEQALASGLPKEQAWAAPAVVLISRGRPVAEQLAEALIEVFGEPEAGTPDAGPLGKDAAFAYFEEYFGEIPSRVALLAERSPTAFEGYAHLHQGALREGPLPPWLVELILCGVNAAEFASAFVQIHADAARRQGATEDQIVGAVLSVIPVSGVAAWPAAADALAR